MKSILVRLLKDWPGTLKSTGSGTALVVSGPVIKRKIRRSSVPVNIMCMSLSRPVIVHVISFMIQTFSNERIIVYSKTFCNNAESLLITMKRN